MGEWGRLWWILRNGMEGPRKMIGAARGSMGGWGWRGWLAVLGRVVGRGRVGVWVGLGEG